MKKNLLFNLFAMVALMFFGSLNAQTTFNVMLVTGNTDVTLNDGTGIHKNDSLLYEKIIGGNLGWTVTVVMDDSTEVNSPTVTDAIANSDLILISSSVGSGNVVVNTEIMEGNLPIISLEYGTWDDQMMYYGDQNDLEIDDDLITISDLAPAAAYGELGTEIVFVDTTIATAKARFLLEGSIVASGAEVWGTVMMRDTAYPVYVYAAAGAQLISPVTGADTSVTRNYDQMLFGLFEPADAKQITEAGWEILERALCYLVGVNHPLDDDTGLSPAKTSDQPFYCVNKALHFQLDQEVSKTEIQIFSISGKLILQEQVNANEVLELSHLQNGLYIVKGSGFAGKFIVE